MYYWYNLSINNSSTQLLYKHKIVKTINDAVKHSKKYQQLCMPVREME